MCCLIGIGKVAGNLLACFYVADKGEVAHLLIAILRLHLAIVQTASVDTRRRACLEAHQLHAILDEGRRQLLSAAQTVRAALIVELAVNNTAAQVGACRQNNAASLKDLAYFGLYADNLAVFHEQLVNHQLLQLQVLLILDDFFHQRVIIRLILLSAQRMDCIALACVQQTHLDARQIRTNAHLSAQSVQLTHQMALCRTADRRVARHQCHII